MCLAGMDRELKRAIIITAVGVPAIFRYLEIKLPAGWHWQKLCILGEHGNILPEDGSHKFLRNYGGPRKRRGVNERTQMEASE
jgi:hypothetical protein